MIEHLIAALERRRSLFLTLQTEKTNCYRIFHGATEGVPGLSIDRYGSVLLVQTWREAMAPHHMEEMATVICSFLNTDLSMIWNHRQKRGQVRHHLFSDLPDSMLGHELGLTYEVQPIHKGIDPLLFLDFRAARRWIQKIANDKTILNLFAYTCGIGMAACSGRAKQVLNVDFSSRSLAIGKQNAAHNRFPSTQFQCIHDDVFPVIRQFSGLGVKGRASRRSFTRRQPQQFDIVVLDPPRMAKSPFGKVDLVHDYPSLFKPALLCVQRGGWILATNNVASVSEEQWHDQLHRCARKIGISFQNVISIRPEEDFPSPDQKWPLKMVACQVMS